MEIDLAQQEQLVRGLLEPAAYPHAVSVVKHLETHISHVLLAGDYAYKLKKPLDLGFLGWSDGGAVDLLGGGDAPITIPASRTRTRVSPALPTPDIAKAIAKTSAPTRGNRPFLVRLHLYEMPPVSLLPGPILW